jgi:hypothetical protein
MKKFYLSLLLGFLSSLTLFSQTLIPVTNELMLPQATYYGVSTVSASRTHVVCRLKLTGLTASATYRYLTFITTDAATPGSVPACGMVAIHNTAVDATEGNMVGLMLGSKSLANTSSKIANNDITNLTTNNISTYDEFTADANGEYTGWFSTVAFGNAKQALNADAYFYVQINNGTSTSGAVFQSFRTTSTIKLLDYTATTTGVTALIGTSTVGNEKLVALYDNIASTGRPLFVTYTENDGIKQSNLTASDGTTPAASNWTTWYGSVDATPGTWGAVIPNNLSTGVRSIQFYNADGTAIPTGNGTPNISADGIWNGVSTVNLTGGSATPVTINSIAPTTLPIKLINFAGIATEDAVKLNWETISETNNKYFEIFKAGDDKKFISFGKVNGAINSSTNKFYSLVDNSPLKGTNYYQLKQYDLDGQSVSFDPIAVKFGLSEDKMSLINNTDNEITLSISSSTAKQGVIYYIQVDGKVLYKKAINLQDGVNIIKVPVAKNEDKIGIITFTSDKEQRSLKVIR